MGAERSVARVGGSAGSQGCFVYFYFMKADPDRVRVVAPRHASYWRELRLAHYLGGPFADRTGGLITFEAAGTALAQRAVYGDLFILEGLVDAHWLKKWTPESKDPHSHGEVDRRQPPET
jgi:hypothetical protein